MCLTGPLFGYIVSKYNNHILILAIGSLLVFISYLIIIIFPLNGLIGSYVVIPSIIYSLGYSSAATII